MGTTIVILILLAIVIMAIFSIRKRIKYGSSCCGTHDATVDLEKNITLVRAKTPQERKHLSEII